MPATPSDWRASRNTRADVRRLLREDGVLTERAKPPAYHRQGHGADGAATPHRARTAGITELGATLGDAEVATAQEIQ